jgi:hypothetical protein
MILPSALSPENSPAMPPAVALLVVVALVALILPVAEQFTTEA